MVQMVNKIATIRKKGEVVSVTLSGSGSYKMGRGLLEYHLGKKIERKKDGGYEVSLVKEKSSREIAYDVLADQGYVVKGKSY